MTTRKSIKRILSVVVLVLAVVFGILFADSRTMQVFAKEGTCINGVFGNITCYYDKTGDGFEKNFFYLNLMRRETATETAPVL